MLEKHRIKKKFLVTGGSGFIGSNLSRFLRQHFHDSVIYILDTFGAPAAHLDTHGSFKNVSGEDFIPIAADISLDTDKIKYFTDSCDGIFHLAAISDTTARDEFAVLQINVNSFHSLISLADHYNCPLIYASSGSVYGLNEKNLPNRIGSESPANIYGYSKFSMDLIARSMNFRTTNNLPIIGLRFFNVYGPREEYKGKASSMILQLARQIHDEGKCRLFSDSDKILRDFVYIEDVCEACIRSLDISPGIYNVGTGISRSFLDIAEIIFSNLGVSTSVDYIRNPYIGSYQFYTNAPLDASNMLYYIDRPPTALEEGILNYLNYLGYTKEIVK